MGEEERDTQRERKEREGEERVEREAEVGRGKSELYVMRSSEKQKVRRHIHNRPFAVKHKPGYF